MANGRDDPDAEEGEILAPEELDISDDDHVTEIDEGRYVVSSDVRTDSEAGSPGPAEHDPVLDGDDEADDDPPEPVLDAATVHEWLRDDLGSASSEHGFDVTAKYDGTVSQQRMVSNDIVTVFESLLLWYARQIDGSTPVEEVLGILLMESNVPVRYPAASLRQLVEASDCSPEDTVADLLEAVEDDGVQL